MERTALPPRVDLTHLRALIRQRKEQELRTITLPIEQVESLIIESALFRNHYDSASRRQKDGARVRKTQRRRITLDNVDQYDESPDG
jgi:hypothetical protein